MWPWANPGYAGWLTWCWGCTGVAGVAEHVEIRSWKQTNNEITTEQALMSNSTSRWPGFMPTSLNKRSALKQFVHEDAAQLIMEMFSQAKETWIFRNMWLSWPTSKCYSICNEHAHFACITLNSLWLSLATLSYTSYSYELAAALCAATPPSSEMTDLT